MCSSDLIIGTRAGLSFMDFVKELTPVIFVIFVIAIGTLIFLFRKGLKATPEKMEHIANLDNSKTITDKALMIRSVATLALVILGFVTHDITHISAFVFAVAGASFLLLLFFMYMFSRTTLHMDRTCHETCCC